MKYSLPVKKTQSTYAKYIDISFAQLKLVREYLGGKGDYDVLGKRTRIQGSCCLPEEKFTSFDRIMLHVNMTGADDSHSVETLDMDLKKLGANVFPRMVSVSSYLKKCTRDETELSVQWLDNIRFTCNPVVVEYLEVLQRNIGHLILSPLCESSFPDGQCNNKTDPNPRAQEFKQDVCVAKFVEVDGKLQSIETPIIKKITPTQHWKHSCPDDKTVYNGATIDAAKKVTIKYYRIPRAELKYYTVTTGLPSFSSINVMQMLTNASSDGARMTGCQYKQGLTAPSGDFFQPATIDSKALEAAKLCPYFGLHEYCNMDQYASYLQKNLFDNEACQVADMKRIKSEKEIIYNTLACAYKIATLTCDCMEAVLNCYEREFKFTEPLSHTVGKAASILCGFILCLKPSVFSLFAGQDAIEKANIMRNLMSQVGLSVPSMASIPPATFAFLSFGLGMVAFVATKYIAKKSRKPVEIEEGYRKLI